MKCAIYRSRKKHDTYLFIEKEGEFDRVPQALKDMLGQLEFVMELELSPDRQLAQADSEQVIRQLRERGFYLQLPPQDRTVDAIQ